MDTKSFYDEGWNAAVDGQPFDKNAKGDWKDGWLDCQTAAPSQRTKI